MMTPEQQAAHEAALTSAAQAVWSSKNFSEKDQGQTLADRPDGIRTRYTQDAATAVTEYQRHMAADVRAALTAYNDALWDWTIAQERNMPFEETVRRGEVFHDAERALLESLGIQEEER